MSYLNIVYERSREPKTTYPSELVRYLIKRFKLQKKDKILEIGVGNGDFLEQFDKKGLVCYGVDIEVSKHVSKKIKIKKVNLVKNKLPYADSFFDIVYSKSVIEHFYRDEINFVMEELKRVLKPGGKIIFLTPDWQSQMATFFEDYTHVHPFDALALADMLKIFSFKNVETEKFYQLPIVWKIPELKIVCHLLSFFLSTQKARRLTEITGLKFFRWSVELMVLGYGKK